MKQAIKILFLTLLATILLSEFCIAANMADGLQCPSDWSRTKTMPPLLRYRTLLKQCVPRTNDAVIELYATRSSSTSLVAELEKWTQDLRRNGLPYQKFLNEQPGHVSGYPAILRFFSGWDRDGKWYDSYLVVSSYRGTYYIFVGYAMKGHDRVRIQMRNAMNAWHYPGASGPMSSGYSNQQSLPDYGPSIGQSTNGNVNINPTVNVNRPGCTRQPAPGSTYTDQITTPDNSYEDDLNVKPDVSGNKPNNSGSSAKPDKEDNNQNNSRPSDNKYLDYILE